MTDAYTGESSPDEAVSNGATMRDRFRGFLPVVVDIETGGFNCHTDAILEIAIAIPSMTEDGVFVIAETHSRNVEPFEGANLDPSALHAPPDEIRRRVRTIIERAGPKGHIFNLGHGITPDIDPDAVAVAVDEVTRWSWS